MHTPVFCVFQLSHVPRYKLGYLSQDSVSALVCRGGSTVTPVL